MFGASLSLYSCTLYMLVVLLELGKNLVGELEHLGDLWYE
jgi:hypothetical protein